MNQRFNGSAKNNSILNLNKKNKQTLIYISCNMHGIIKTKRLLFHHLFFLLRTLDLKLQGFTTNSTSRLILTLGLSTSPLPSTFLLHSWNPGNSLSSTGSLTSVSLKVSMCSSLCLHG